MKKDEFGNSQDAAEAAECASWRSRQMHGGRSENERSFQDLALARYAKELGLDPRQLRRGAGALLRALQAG